MNPNLPRTEMSKRVTGNHVFHAERSDPSAGRRQPQNIGQHERRGKAMSARDGAAETPIELVAILGEN
jgi:hypothetical protein